MRGVDDVELGVDIDALDLIDQDDGGIAVDRDVARRDLDGETLVRAVTRLLHQFARLFPVGVDVGAVARDRFQHFLRHRPQSAGGRKHGAADIGLPLEQDLDERLAIQRQR